MNSFVFRLQSTTKMVFKFVCFSVCFIFSHEVFSFSYIDNLPEKKPNKILVDQKNHFYVDYKNKVAVLSDKLDYIVYLGDPKENYSTNSFDNAISPNGHIHSLIISSYQPDKSDVTYYRLNVVECVTKKCRYQLINHWSSGKSATSYQVSKLVISKKGNVFYYVTRQFKSGKKWQSEIVYYLNRNKITASEYKNTYANNFPKNKSGVNLIISNKNGPTEFLFEVDGETKSLEKRSTRYTRTFVLDKDENPHVFFHNSVDRSFYHQFYSFAQEKIIEVLVDNSESGWENIAFLTDKDIWTIHYFYRDPYNKGMLVTRQNLKNGAIEEKFVIDASDLRNTGWDLMGAQSSENRVLLTYISDQNQKKREFVILDRVEDIKNELGENFSLYGHPKGKGYLKYIPEGERDEHIKSLNLTHKVPIRVGYLNAGIGVQRIFWKVKSAVPDDSSNVTTPYDPEYELSASYLSSVFVEGKYGSTNYGLEYATKFIDKEANNSGSDSTKAINKLMGKIGWDRLIFNFDFSFQYEKTDSKVFFSDKSGQVADKTFTINFQEMKFSLLSMKRLHFGYIYQKYNFYQPVYIYKVSEGSTSYRFFGQAIGDIDAKNHLAHLGYSTVDYITKYETYINDWFIDTEVRAGISIAEFKSDTISTGVKKPDNELALVLAAQLEAGYIWYKRWKSFYQFGGLLKLSYRVDYSLIGDSDKPKNLDDPASKDQYTYAYERSELRHGPMLFMSLVF